MGTTTTSVSLAPRFTPKRPLGKAYLTPEMKEVTVTARTATRTATRGVLYVHSAPSALCPHIEWGISGVLGVPVSLDWIPQPAQSGAYRAELSWSGDTGSAAAVASALRGWDHLRFEITEEPTASSEGARYSYTPELGVYHAVTGLHGDIMIPEDRLKAAVVKAALGDTTLLDRDRQAARQAVGRRAGDLPARRRRGAGALAAPSRLRRAET